ncbi:hypothetical protein PoB_000327100 [Plakobranchus ocellatus]|uniref:Uncharacterized protein n=1 Tax=Plakobranchus ocellatus TaxID=259542 RepID=A0AAV3Y2S1_9GAST|nr:hypothetical protein PoB_000327100 [Plakobranchus ocellatus]
MTEVAWCLFEHSGSSTGFVGESQKQSANQIDPFLSSPADLLHSARSDTNLTSGKAESEGGGVREGGAKFDNNDENINSGGGDNDI